MTGLTHGPVAGEVLGRLAAVIPEVEKEVDREQDPVDEQPLGKEAEEPAERRSAQVHHEERRISERRQQAARVGDDADEEEDGVDFVLPLLDRVQDGPDEEHGRAGRSHERSEDGAGGEEGRVRQGLGLHVSGEMDPAGDGEQGAEEDEEGDVVEGERPADLGGVVAGEEEADHGQAQEDGDEKLVPVLFPEFRRGEGEDGDGEQHQEEGEAGPQGDGDLVSAHGPHYSNRLSDAVNGGR